MFQKIPFPDSPAPTSALRFRLLKKYSLLQTITQGRQEEQTMPLMKITFLNILTPFSMHRTFLESVAMSWLLRAAEEGQEESSSQSEISGYSTVIGGEHFGPFSRENR